MKLGDLIKQARLFNGITQRQLADKIGMDYINLSNIERGRTKYPSVDIIKKIANVLDIDDDFMLIHMNHCSDELRQAIIKNRRIPDIIKKFSMLSSEQLDVVIKTIDILLSRENPPIELREFNDKITILLELEESKTFISHKCCSNKCNCKE